ncbi:MAG: hypothetical protein ABI254_10000 [Chthoniobacterales bacterium]
MAEEKNTISWNQKILLPFLGLVAWWLVFAFYETFPDSILLFVIIGFIIFAASIPQRDNALGFVLWFPITGGLVSLLLTGLLLFYGEVGSSVQAGPSMAPLEGAAFTIGAAILLGAIVFLIICIQLRPRIYPTLICILTVLNTIAIGIVGYNCYENSIAQIVDIRILDSAGKPIPNVEVWYRVFGYNPEGASAKNMAFHDPPILSNLNGNVQMRSKKGRHETYAVFKKAGYEAISMQLGMQYNEWQTSRDIYLLAKNARIATSKIPNTEPIKFTIYLPKFEEANPPAGRHNFSTTFPETGGMRYLDLTKRQFTDDPQADLRFDFFEEKDSQGDSRPRLRITGLNGVRIQQVPFDSSLVNPLSSFDNVMKMASVDGYEESIVLKDPGCEPGPRVYVKTQKGDKYIRLVVDGSYSPREPHSPGRVNVVLFENPANPRVLMSDGGSN